MLAVLLCTVSGRARTRNSLLQTRLGYARPSRLTTPPRRCLPPMTTSSTRCPAPTSHAMTGTPESARHRDRVRCQTSEHARSCGRARGACALQLPDETGRERHSRLRPGRRQPEDLSYVRETAGKSGVVRPRPRRQILVVLLRLLRDGQRKDISGPDGRPVPGVARWTFPERWSATGTNDASGGIWDGETLVVSHHHFQVVYRLRAPNAGPELELVEAMACPFPGQGIAVDPKVRGGLIGTTELGKSFCSPRSNDRGVRWVASIKSC